MMDDLTNPKWWINYLQPINETLLASGVSQSNKIYRFIGLLTEKLMLRELRRQDSMSDCFLISEALDLLLSMLDAADEACSRLELPLRMTLDEDRQREFVMKVFS